MLPTLPEMVLQTAPEEPILLHQECKIKGLTLKGVQEIPMDLKFPLQRLQLL